MSLCVVCSSLASVFCTQDKAFLCSGCDRSIHSANVLARRHHRLPVCELCKRNGATVYCHEDAAALCSGCEAEVHSANPVPHHCVPIDSALAQGLAKVTELPPETSSAGGGGDGGGASASPSSANEAARPAVQLPATATGGPATQQQLQQLAPAGAIGASNNNNILSPLLQDAHQQQQQAAEDEVSACGEHSAMHHPAGCMHGGKRQTDAGASMQHSPSEGNTSLAVVPDMGAQAGASAFPTMGLPTQDALNQKAPWAREFDALDFESAWFGLDAGFDLSDLLGNDAAGLTDDAPGMVPSFPMGNTQQLGGAPSSAAGAQLVPTVSPAVGALPLPDAQQAMFDLGDSLPPLSMDGGAHKGMQAPGHLQPHLHAHHQHHQPQPAPGFSEPLPPTLLDDDFVVPSFLPEDDDAMAAHYGGGGGGASAARAVGPHHHAHQHHHQQHSQHPHAGDALHHALMGDEEEVDAHEDGEHAAARAVAVMHDDGAAASKYGTRGTSHTNKRGASVSAEDLHRQSGRMSVAPKPEEMGLPTSTMAVTTRKAAGVPPPPPLSGAALLSLNGANLTREQRVARYREKRKNRKFHKTIRYASRKAYAEVRPRIKGRFATKEEVEAWKAKKAAGEAIAPEDELIF